MWSENGGTVNPTTTTQVVAGPPDLWVSTVTLIPTAPVLAPGTTFQLSDTTRNDGTGASATSTTRYYLGLNLAKDAGDSMIGTRTVPGLAAFTGNSGTVTVTIPSTLPLGIYYVVACADDLNTVVETDEGNNCKAAGPVTVARPDLVVTTAVPSPPAPIQAPGTTFSVSDTVRNSGTGTSGASTTRYYLSLDGVKNAGDILLTGTRTVPGLAAGATSAGLVTVTIPSTTPLNTFSLLVCADDLNTVAESNEGNNCIVASSGTVTVTRPDLAEITVTMTPTSPVRTPGTTFSVTDTTQNFGAASGASTTRYYLSLDVMKNAGDTLLTGSRSVPGLATFVTSSGTVTVTIPSTTPLNTYFLLACATI